MDLGIAGRSALVTASSAGLGRGSAAALAAEGVRVVICGRRPDVLKATEAELRAAGGDVHAVVADVTDPGSPRRLVAEAVDRFGGLDILVANAGGPPRGRALEVTEDQIRAALEANMLTSVRLVHEALPSMRVSGWGRIVLITSVAIKAPMDGLALSNLDRTGLWAWAKTAASDLFDEGITLNTACPGTHLTARTQGHGGVHQRAGDPADFGKVVAFLCSAAARFVSGTAVGIDGASVAGLL